MLVIRGRVAIPLNEIDRITSYNVCYTKLLRLQGVAVQVGHGQPVGLGMFTGHLWHRWRVILQYDDVVAGGLLLRRLSPAGAWRGQCETGGQQQAVPSYNFV